ncbi:hypothetical protein [Streptococcus mutans]|uniref:hypothetical protein n=1 Tax=Streptococcus mutans TaxID=1309 RepID=UPI0014550EAC|nr:hypothetical protein [Streptococcus mutans]MCB5035761.1 hypothetical protein [Streptococcus mutans]
MGFLCTLKKLYNLYSGFTHYRDYRAVQKEALTELALILYRYNDLHITHLS